jgi:hypothetical protein
MGAFCPYYSTIIHSIGVNMRESILDLTLAIVIGLSFAVLALAYFDVLFF